MSRKARVEGAQSPVVSGGQSTPADDLTAIVEAYKAKFDDWGDIALWPLEGGLIHMAEKLRG